MAPVDGVAGRRSSICIAIGGSHCIAVWDGGNGDREGKKEEDRG